MKWQSIAGLTVVVPTVGRLPRLRACLCCLAHQGEHIARVLVVADGLDERARSDLDRMIDSLDLPCQQETLAANGVGRAGARNLGALHGTSASLLFVDDDILLVDGALRSLSAALQDVSVATVGILELPQFARTRDPAKHPRFGPRLRESVLRSQGIDTSGMRHLRTPLQTAADDVGTQAGQPFDRIRFLTVTGASLAIRRESFVNQLGFDQAFGLDWGCEDLELGYRLLSGGESWRHFPAHGYHMTHPRAGRWEQHDRTLRRFQTLHPQPEVQALDELLGPSGTYAAYRRTLDRTAALPHGSTSCEV